MHLYFPGSMLSIVSGAKSEMLTLENQFCKGSYTPFKDQKLLDDEYGKILNSTM